jgi:predicted ABC-type transport system involved in lysophospholipase L1 biosynthesis ATPase subunit
MRSHGHAAFSPRVLEALAHFGLSPGELDSESAPRRHEVRSLARELSPGSITLITGPSGSGKSTLLRALAASVQESGRSVLVARDMLRSREDRRVLDLCAPLDAFAAMRLLSRVGLGDAAVFARRACELSDGQRARLRLALALRRARGTRGVVIADEFTSGLDRPTARSMCVALRKSMIEKTPSDTSDTGIPPVLVLATAHDDVAQWLSPNAHARVGLDHQVRVDRQESSTRVPIRVSKGTYADYARLAGLHYRAGRPAMLAPGGIRVAHVSGLDVPAGVLVLAMPTLNARWRELAWPGRYRSGDLRRDAQRLNRELRTIARVIVDPRVRGLGVAASLIRAYLRDPLTPATEAIAAMGAACPMFARAGMVEYRLPPSARDARLLDAMDSRGVLLQECMLGGAAQRVAGDALLKRELARWVGSSRATQRVGHSVRESLHAATRTIGAMTIAYAYSS